MARASVLTTARGSRAEAFGTAEWGLLSAVALMWGSSFLFVDIGLRAFRPGLITLLRLALGAVALSLAPRSRASVDRGDWPRIALLGLIWMAVPLLLFPIAQDLQVPSSAAGMINGAMPLFAALFGALLLRRMPTRREGLGLLTGFAGVLLIFLPTANAPRTALGAALALVATVLYGLAANVAVPLQQRYGAVPVVFRAQLVAIALVAPFGIAAIPASRFEPQSLAALVALGVLGTGLAFIAMAVLVGRVGATRGAVAIYFIPVVALVLGVLVLHEEVAPISLAGIALVLAGAWLTSRKETDR